MKKRIIKLISNLVQFIYDHIFTHKVRSMINNILTEKNKKRIKNLLRNGKKQINIRKIKRTKYRLKNLGFIDAGYNEMVEYFNQDKDRDLKEMAAFELALWHSDQYTKKDAKQALDYLNSIRIDRGTAEFKRQITILKAENLNFLGHNIEAKQLIEKLINTKQHPDLFLSYVNLLEDPADKVKWINKVYDLYQLPEVKLDEAEHKSLYDQLTVDYTQSSSIKRNERVSIIIPVFNAETVLSTALTSLQNQTWENLEIIVVDDCSKDNTIAVAEEFAKKDSRIKVIQTETNGGPYIARNIALNQATGEFVTINDADDWSHPCKIQRQAEHLINNPKIIGNTSEQARLTEELDFYRRGKPGLYIFGNMSSFMFRRKAFVDKIGYWDSVRFGADSEAIKRIKRVFGEKSIEELKTGPLSFQRQSSDSLTGNSAFGFPGYFMGARKEYLEAQLDYHQRADSIKYTFPQEKRPFPIPEPMRPTREVGKGERRHFDVIIVSDFRLEGGSTLSCLEEIKAQKKMGIKTGLVQLARFDYVPNKKINPLIRDMIDGDLVQMIVYGEKVSCDLLILRYPPILEHYQRYVPDIQAKSINVIINQTPMSDYGVSGERRYNIEKCQKQLIEYFNKEAIWFPIGPLVRQALEKYHAEELKSIQLSDKDWVNIIDVEEWKSNERKRERNIIKIGRHSRAQAVKWPDNKEDILQIYPDKSPYQVHILGGAEAPEKVLGYIPDNWIVKEFGEVDPNEFLANIDIFVYYTRSDWIESFGRVIIEAMAAGVPVVISPEYKELFGGAAIYASPDQVTSKVQELISDGNYYERQQKIAWEYVNNNFGYAQHQSRLEEWLNEQK
ncbi:glycosyltransferase [Gracilibacillus suaedae]|uniref:glycosyltransferase n=1 Tax=Gracilibacillus suaedae TaxID=2820273 RepID=UPI001ABE4990|nr:glycosyltransferase [Gracilibacillus suaedae]